MAVNSPPFAMTPARWRHLSIAVAAGIAGLAINVMPLGTLAVIWPGRIVTLPVAILLGPWFGVVSAVIAAAPYFARPPLVVLVLVAEAEAVIVGVFAQRGKSHALIGGALVWVLVAVSLMAIPGAYGY